MELFLMTGMINISLKLCLKKQLLGYGIDIKSVPFHSFPIKKVAFFHQKSLFTTGTNPVMESFSVLDFF